MADAYKERGEECVFCDPNLAIVAEDDLSYAIRDAFAVTPGHTLVIPRRHVVDYFDLCQPELNAANGLLHQLKEQLSDKDDSISGFNVGINSGASARQTIWHATHT